MSNLGIALLRKARIGEDEADVTRAVAVLGQALKTIGPDDPGRALTLYALGAAHARAFELGNAEALDLGLAALRQAGDIDGASTAVRIRSNRDRGRLAASGHAFDEAMDGFGGGVRLMEEAAWAGTGRADQQRLLTELNGLPMDAAAMAIEAGRLEEAVEGAVALSHLCTRRGHDRHVSLVQMVSARSSKAMRSRCRFGVSVEMS